MFYPRRFREFRSLVRELPVAAMDVVGLFHSPPSWAEKKYEPTPGPDYAKVAEEGDTEIIVSIDNKRKTVDATNKMNPREIAVTHGKHYLRMRGFFKLGEALRPMDLLTQLERRKTE